MERKNRIEFPWKFLIVNLIVKLVRGIWPILYNYAFLTYILNGMRGSLYLFGKVGRRTGSTGPISILTELRLTVQSRRVLSENIVF